jgi:hypothetical protein
MKLNGSKLVAVAMMVGALGAMGCKSNVLATDDVAPEDNPASAPVNDSASEATSSLWGRTRYYYSPYAPPAARVEVRGRSPGERYFWSPGYHRWDGRRYVWNDGRYYERRNGYEYVGPRWANNYGRWEYVPGHWQRRY